jgi:DUF4097 and DUF4098 domain-containing protein YvlB
MRTLLALTGLTLIVCAPAAAQQSGDRVVVPARNSSRPRLVKANLTNGSISVKTYAGKEVIVESKDAARQKPEQTRDGLRRIQVPGAGGLEVIEEDNVITVRADKSNQNLLISVPVETSLQLKATNGDIEVDGVHGEIDVSSRNGKVTVTGVAGTVLADSHNGNVKVAMTRVDAGKPLSFSSYNGNVDVTLPADFKANVKIRANSGEVYSDFDMKLSPGPATTEKSDDRDARFRVRTDGTAIGTINGGGTEASFTTFNGKIAIRKK